MRKHGFGLIGCGCIARNHLKAVVSLDNAQLTAVCDIVDERLAEAKEQYGCRT
jgi:UDP-N-acetyl-2-amino-2-deoxyglucuronate dehydrogenase